MNVTLVHPLYGAKVAINETEIQNDEKNGWTRYNTETPPVQRTRRRMTVEQPNGATAPASEESEGT